MDVQGDCATQTVGKSALPAPSYAVAIFELKLKKQNLL